MGDNESGVATLEPSPFTSGAAHVPQYLANAARGASSWQGLTLEVRPPLPAPVAALTGAFSPAMAE